jgi:hypothetical protein
MSAMSCKSVSLLRDPMMQNLPIVWIDLNYMILDRCNEKLLILLKGEKFT